MATFSLHPVADDYSLFATGSYTDADDWVDGGASNDADYISLNRSSIDEDLGYTRLVMGGAFPADFEYADRVTITARVYGGASDDGLQLTATLELPPGAGEPDTYSKEFGRIVNESGATILWAVTLNQWDERTYEIATDIPVNRTRIQQMLLRLDASMTRNMGDDGGQVVRVSAVRLDIEYTPTIPASYQIDFGGETAGAGLPVSLTDRWASGIAWSIEESGAAIGRRQLVWDSPTSGRNAASFDAIPVRTRNCEALMRLRLRAGTGGDSLRFMMFGGGAAGNETALLFEFDTTEDVTGEGPLLEVRRYLDSALINVAKAPAPISTEVWWLLRVRLVDDVLWVRVWREHEEEPAAWGIDGHDLVIPESTMVRYDGINREGWFGVGNFATGDYELDWIKVETGIDPASPDAPFEEYFTDFSEYTVGQAPPDWIQPWGTTHALEIHDDATVTNISVGKALVVQPSGNARSAIVPQDMLQAPNGEILVRWLTSAGGDTFRAMGRVGGVAPAQDAVFAEANIQPDPANSTGRIRYYSGGTLYGGAEWSVPLEPLYWNYTRFRVYGDQVRATTWYAPGNDGEPYEAGASINGISNQFFVTDPGWWGWGFFSGTGYYIIDWISMVVSHGSSFPTAPYPDLPEPLPEEHRSVVVRAVIDATDRSSMAQVSRLLIEGVASGHDSIRWTEDVATSIAAELVSSDAFAGSEMSRAEITASTAVESSMSTQEAIAIAVESLMAATARLAVTESVGATVQASVTSLDEIAAAVVEALLAAARASMLVDDALRAVEPTGMLGALSTAASESFAGSEQLRDVLALALALGSDTQQGNDHLAEIVRAAVDDRDALSAIEPFQAAVRASLESTSEVHGIEAVSTLVRVSYSSIDELVGALRELLRVQAAASVASTDRAALSDAPAVAGLVIESSSSRAAGAEGVGVRVVGDATALDAAAMEELASIAARGVVVGASSQAMADPQVIDLLGSAIGSEALHGVEPGSVLTVAVVGVRDGDLSVTYLVKIEVDAAGLPMVVEAGQAV